MLVDSRLTNQLIACMEAIKLAGIDKRITEVLLIICRSHVFSY